MRRTGTVKFFDRDRGFGFIVPQDGGNDVFVHVTAVQNAGIPYLKEEMQVSFEIQNDSRGRGEQAIVLQLLSIA